MREGGREGGRGGERSFFKFIKKNITATKWESSCNL